jgi:hypothetical protein
VSWPQSCQPSGIIDGKHKKLSEYSWSANGIHTWCFTYKKEERNPLYWNHLIDEIYQFPFIVPWVTSTPFSYFFKLFSYFFHQASDVWEFVAFCKVAQTTYMRNNFRIYFPIVSLAIYFCCCIGFHLANKFSDHQHIITCFIWCGIQRRLMLYFSGGASSQQNVK